MRFSKIYYALALNAYLILPALAQEAAPSAPAESGKGMLLQLPMLLALFALFYFGLIRPQRNQAKQHADFVSKLNRGDEIVTNSGIIGTIRGLTEKVVTLEISEGTEIRVLKSQIQNRLKDVVGASAETKA